MKQPDHSRDSLLAKAALVLLIALLALFLFYFVIYNNLTLILYSFIFFVILAFVLAYDKKLSESALLLSLSLLVSSYITYAGLCNAYYVVGAVLIVPLLGILFQAGRIGKGHLSIILLTLMLPIPFSLALSNMSYMVNVEAISYYLMISVALAVFLVAFAASNGLEGRARKLVERAMVHKRTMLAVFIVASVAVLLSPIWPANVSIRIDALPYVPISFAGGPLAPGNYSLTFNASAYGPYETENLSNVRFLSQGGSTIDARMLSNSSFTNTRAAVLLELPAGASEIRLSFLPKNFSFDSHLRPVNATQHYAPMPINASFGNLTGGLNYSEHAMQYTIYRPRSVGSNESLVSSPYYETEQLCTPGNGTRASVSVVSNVTASLFLFNSSSGFYQALADSRRYVPYAAYLNTSPYVLYVNSFADRTDMRVLNGTRMSLNFSFPENASCVQYVVAFNTTAKLKVGTVTHYLTYAAREAWVYGPEEPSPQGIYLNYSSGFLPDSIVYAISRWHKFWAVSPTLPGSNDIYGAFIRSNSSN